MNIQSQFIANTFGNHTVRAIDRNGEVWFVAADVCNALEIANPSMAIKRLDDDEVATLINNEGRAGSGAQTFNIINESGLYSLVLKSRKEAARLFKKWVTSEVLPAIRKTGSYQGESKQESIDFQAYVSNDERIKSAFEMAAEVASQVSRVVFTEMLTNNYSWSEDRWLFCTRYESSTEKFVPHAHLIPRDAIVMPASRFAQYIRSESPLITNKDLSDLAVACSSAIAKRLVGNK